MSDATKSFGSKLGLLNNAAIGDEYYDQLRTLLRGIDALVQASVVSSSVLIPPASPNDGDGYLINGIGAGDWTGHDGQIAVWAAQATQAGNNTLSPAWDFYTPKSGWLIWNITTASFMFFNGTSWSQLGTGGITKLTGDVTTASGSGIQESTISDSAVTLAKIQDAESNNVLLGSGSSGSGSPYSEITLGANLSMSGTTLNATGGSSGGSGQIYAVSAYVATPPTTPNDGDTYILDTSHIGGTLTGAWVGHDHQIATWSSASSSWSYTSPVEGMFAWVNDSKEYMYWDSTSAYWHDGMLLKNPPTGISQTVNVPTNTTLGLGGTYSSSVFNTVELDAFNVYINAYNQFIVGKGDGSGIASYGDGTIYLQPSTVLAVSAPQTQFTGTIEYQCLRATSGTYTVSLTRDDIIAADASAGNIVVNLPALGGAGTGSGFQFTVKKIDSSANTVTVTPNAAHADTIDGAATYVLSAQYSVVTFFSATMNNQSRLQWFIKYKM